MLIFVLGASAGGVLAVDFKTYLEGAQAEILSHKSSIRDDPLDEVAFFELGKAYLALGRHEEEIAAYQEAVKLNSKYSAAHFNLSMAYDLLKDGPNAIKHMLRAQDLYVEERKHAQIRKVQRQLKFFYLKYQRKSIIP
ncbi:MAG: tetratricopeptide repeat protein [Nitrospinaceae bacterium]